jgi:hypothetical protein
MILIQPPTVQNWNSLVNKPQILSDNQISWDEIQNKPTTLAGYGITNGQPLGNELTALQDLSDSAGFLKKTGNGTYSIDVNSYLNLTGGTVTGNLVSTSATASTSTTTGAIRAASLGITGAIFAGSLNGNRLYISHTSTENLSANPNWPSGTLKLEDNSTFDSGIGPSIIFYKKRDASGNQSVAAGITATGVYTSEKLQFYVGSASSLGSSPKMTIQVDGNVGIGTVSPSQKLDVNGSAKATSFFVGTNQVVSARRTGWAVPTGTATRTTFATSTITLSQLAERVKGLIDDLTAHGLIGA